MCMCSARKRSFDPTKRLPLNCRVDGLVGTMELKNLIVQTGQGLYS